MKIYGSRDRYKIKKTDTVIMTVSISQNWSKGLSPFYLGPCDLYDNYKSTCVENGYQYSKIYDFHLDDWGELDEKKWWEWAKEGWNNPRGIRYPAGKGTKPICGYWKGEKLNYIQSREQIYIPLYTRAVRNTDAFEFLRREYNKNKEIILFDFDGYDYESEGKTLLECRKDPNKILGHAFILAALLEDNKDFFVDLSV